MIRKTLAAFGLVIIVFMGVGYQRAHTSEFKVRCALEQVGAGDMNVADAALCRLYYRLG